MTRVILFAALGLLAAEPLLAQASLNGRAETFTSYFVNKKRMRHNRFQLNLLQTTTINPQLNTVIEGRFRFDAAVYPQEAPYSKYEQTVRDDEMAETEARQLYLDYLSESSTLKLGLQQIDWVESLSPRTVDVFSSLDLRHGGSGESREIIEPVFAALVNRSFSGVSVELLVVPFPKHHRLAKGNNGYGLYEKLNGDQGDQRIIVEEDIPDQFEEIELGTRILTRVDSVELSAMALRGHQRSPAIRVTNNSPSESEWRLTFPRSNTFGLGVTYAGNSYVFRVMTYFEPKREPDVFFTNLPLVDPNTGLPTGAFFGQRQIFEERFTYGLGFDYDFSKHLKLYSEHFLREKHFFYAEAGSGEILPIEEKTKVERQNSVRLTNESFESWYFTVDLTAVGPEVAFSISPQAAYGKNNYKFILGSYFIESQSEKSSFETLKETNQVYFKIQRFFDAT